MRVQRGKDAEDNERKILGDTYISEYISKSERTKYSENNTLQFYIVLT